MVTSSENEGSHKAAGEGDVADNGSAVHVRLTADCSPVVFNRIVSAFKSPLMNGDPIVVNSIEEFDAVFGGDFMRYREPDGPSGREMVERILAQSQRPLTIHVATPSFTGGDSNCVGISARESEKKP